MPKRTYGRAGMGVRKMAMPWLLTGLIACAVLLALTGWFLTSGSFMAVTPCGGLVLVVCAMVAAKVLKDVDRRTSKMERGWKAEDDVEKVLATLGEEAWVVHDVAIGQRGNIDHVVVMPAAVYTIETKSHRGKVTFDGQQLLLNGRGLEKDFLAQAYAEAMALKEYLAKISGGDDYFVRPLIVFTNGFVQVKGLAKGVKVLPLKWLNEELMRGKPRLSEVQCSAVARSLKHLTSD